MSTPDNPFAAPAPGAAQQPQSYGQPPQAQPPYGYGPPPGYGPAPVPGGYPSPYPGWQPAPQTDGTAVAVLVLAICSFFVFPVVPAIVALVLAPGAERDIAASGGRLTGETLLRAGKIVAWLNLALFVGGLLLVLGFFALVASVGAA